MERLTFKKWFEFYKPDEETTTISVKGYTQITELEGARGNKGFYLVGEAVDKLAAYEDLEEQGLLLRLPCKVGDVVYYIQGGYYKKPQYCKVKPIEVTEISLKNNRSGKNLDWAIIANGTRYKISSIGKTVFLTKAEAEAALEKMKGEEHEK